MLELKLTPAAVQTLYGGGRVILCDAAVRPLLEQHVRDAFSVVCCLPDGRVFLPEEDASGASLAALGMPVTLCAFLLTAQSKPVYAEWGSERLLAKAGKQIPVLIVSPTDEAAELNILRFLAGVQNSAVREKAKIAASLEAQVVYLRQVSERMMISLSLSERIMESIGYDSVTEVAVVTPGRGRVGPDTQTLHRFRQVAPVDGLGLAGIALYVAEEARSEGQLDISVHRDLDNKKLASFAAPYAALKAGWYRHMFEDVVSDVFGDISLEVTWQSSTPGRAPKLALADIRADRFGINAAGESLALKFYKGICRPDLSQASLSTLNVPADIKFHTRPAFFPARLGFYGGDKRLASARAEQDFASMQRSDRDGWVQCHLASDGLTGVTFATDKLHGTACYVLHLELPDARAPLMIAYAVFAKTLDNIEAHISALFDGTVHRDIILSHANTVIAGGEERLLTLTLDKEAAHGGYIVVVARSLEGRHNAGWLRLNSIETKLPVSALCRERLPVAKRTKDDRWLVRSFRLPELGGMIEFVEGGERREELSRSLGFSPMLLDENGGYLQTHPLLDRVSAAIAPGIAPAGTRKLVATAATGHPSAPDFIYLFAAIRHDVHDVVSLMAQIAVEAQAEDYEDGNLRSTTGGFWVARRLKASEASRLELDFSEPLDVPYHVVFAALPIDGINSYGWCRWTSLGLISSDEAVT